jgi:hypothetical protein
LNLRYVYFGPGGAGDPAGGAGVLALVAAGEGEAKMLGAGSP